VIVLAVWATWCLPCIDLIESLEVLKKEFGAEVQVVGLTTEPKSSGTELLSFLRERNIDFEIGWIDQEQRQILLAGRDAIPSMFVVRKDGSVIRRFIGWNTQNTNQLLREAVKEALQSGSIK